MVAAATGESYTKKEHFYDAKAVDIYAMGVCLFEMLNLTRPYVDEMDVHTFSKIKEQKIKYPTGEVEEACKELIAKMLRMKPIERPMVDDVLKHRWICFGTTINKVTTWVSKMIN